uniref:Uncharacterized protein LOC104246732 n=1 Tax=Nicotiana sylvestris TaxID=4096 RepID=A0A1U7YCP9_NICSY|nr:PREDICTED: uncharacterized protein LOC104246732 [Nicotiana sylvestris]
MKKKKDSERREPKREKNLVLMTDSNGTSDEDNDMAYLTRRFQKMVRRNGGIPKRGSSSKPKNYDLYHKCGKLGHFIKDCPLLKQDQYKNNFDKAAKRNLIPDKRLNRKNTTNNVVKQALASDDDDDDDDEGKSERKKPTMGNKVEFVSKICIVRNLVTCEVVLVAKRYKNIYVADFESLKNGDLSCLIFVVDDAELWHKRLGHASFTLLNKLVKKDLIQVKIGNKVACIRSDHGTEFNNVKFDEFCTENGITHNFLAPRTPQ